MKGMVGLSSGILIVLIGLFGTEISTSSAVLPGDTICSTTPLPSIVQILSRASQDQWLTYLQELTGEKDVTISGHTRRISTRFTPNLFDGSVNALAFIYLEEQLSSMQYPSHVMIDQFGFLEHEYTYNGNNWKNLILTIPGLDPVNHRELILSAHLDDLPVQDAPGAEDNGVGVAALLEIARVLRFFQFDVTIKLIWFTGEEQGLRGSQAYLSDYGMFSEDLIGAINLDMFGYDSDGDDCFEIHAGDLSESYVLGDCLVNTLAAYNIPLAFDYLQTAIPGAASDHRPFWEHGFGAIEILENHFAVSASDDYHQCGSDADPSPYYHTVNDTIANSIDIPMAFNVVRASLATATTLAQPQGACFLSEPELTHQLSLPSVILNWLDMGDLITYRLYRSTSGCEGPWSELADNLYTTSYLDSQIPATNLAYQLEAIAPSGMCISLPSNCVTDISIYWSFIPLVSRWQ